MKRISGYVDVPEADRDAFAAALPEHSRLTNMEAGCICFRVTAEAGIPGRYRVEEVFENAAAYEQHAARTRETIWAHVTRNITRHYTED